MLYNLRLPGGAHAIEVFDQLRSVDFGMFLVSMKANVSIHDIELQCLIQCLPFTGDATMSVRVVDYQRYPHPRYNAIKRSLNGLAPETNRVLHGD